MRLCEEIMLNKSGPGNYDIWFWVIFNWHDQSLFFFGRDSGHYSLPPTNSEIFFIFLVSLGYKSYVYCTRNQAPLYLSWKKSKLKCCIASLYYFRDFIYLYHGVLTLLNHPITLSFILHLGYTLHPLYLSSKPCSRRCKSTNFEKVKIVRLLTSA